MVLLKYYGWWVIAVAYFLAASSLCAASLPVIIPKKSQIRKGKVLVEGYVIFRQKLERLMVEGTTVNTFACREYLFVQKLRDKYGQDAQVHVFAVPLKIQQEKYISLVALSQGQRHEIWHQVIPPPRDVLVEFPVDCYLCINFIKARASTGMIKISAEDLITIRDKDHLGAYSIPWLYTEDSPGFNSNHLRFEIEGIKYLVNNKVYGLSIFALNQLSRYVKIPFHEVAYLEFRGHLNADMLPTLARFFPNLKALKCQGFNDQVLKLLPNFFNLRVLDLEDYSIGRKLSATLKAFVNLRALSLEKTNIDNMDLATLPQLGNLRHLSLNFTRVSNAGLSYVGRIKELRSLALWGTHIDDSGLNDLKKLNNLRSLDLGWTKITNAGLVALVDLENIQTLSLNSTAVEDSGLVYLATFDKLHTLQLEFTKITDQGIHILKNFRDLYSLALGSTLITDVGVDELRNLRDLNILVLRSTKVGDLGVCYLSELSKLRFLDLWSTKITNRGLIHLKQLDRLDTLSLGDTKITEEGLKHLTEMGRLRNLELNWTMIGDSGLQKLVELDKLEYLSLVSTHITDQGLAVLENLRRLRGLLLNWTDIGNQGLSYLARLPKLQKLSLSGTKISDEGLVHLEYLHRLRNLSLTATHISDKKLLNLLKLPALHVLSLKGIAVSDDLGIYCLENMDHLRILALDNDRISTWGRKRLKQKLPGCMLDIQASECNPVIVGDPSKLADPELWSAQLEQATPPITSDFQKTKDYGDVFFPIAVVCSSIFLFYWILRFKASYDIRKETKTFIYFIIRPRTTKGPQLSYCGVHFSKKHLVTFKYKDSSKMYYWHCVPWGKIARAMDQSKKIRSSG